MPPQPISAMPGRSFGLVGGLTAVSAAVASCLCTNHKGNPVAAAVAVQDARKERREIWTGLFMRIIEGRKFGPVKRNRNEKLIFFILRNLYKSRSQPERGASLRSNCWRLWRSNAPRSVQ